MNSKKGIEDYMVLFPVFQTTNLNTWYIHKNESTIVLFCPPVCDVKTSLSSNLPDVVLD
jgi:hypothetical protein